MGGRDHFSTEWAFERPSELFKFLMEVRWMGALGTGVGSAHRLIDPHLNPEEVDELVPALELFG